MFPWLKKALPIPETTGGTGIGSQSDSTSCIRQGNELLNQGRLDEAAECYSKAITIDPGHAEGFLNLGFVLKEQKRYEEAEYQLRQAIAINPELEDAYYILGTLSQEQENLEDAIKNFSKVIELNPKFVRAYHDLSSLLLQTGQNERAKQAIEQSLLIYRELAGRQSSLGDNYCREQDFPRALACYQKVLSLIPDFAEAHSMLGSTQRDHGDFDMALACYDKTLALNSDDAEAHINAGSVFHARGQLDKAEECYRRAICIKPDSVEAYNNLGLLFANQKCPDEALSCYRQALELKPDSPEVLNNLGVLLRAQGKLDEAVVCLREALAFKPDLPNVHNNLGAIFMDQRKFEEARSCYQLALQYQPDYFLAHNNLGVLSQLQGKLEQAMASYRQALRFAPDLHQARANLLFVSQQLCEWMELEALSNAVREAVRERPPQEVNLIPPFSFLAIPGSTGPEQKTCAHNWAQRICQTTSGVGKKMNFQFGREPRQKLRIGYLSADYRDHPVAHLMAQIFELHNRDRFHITAYSFGPNDGSSVRQRMEKAFDRFKDICEFSDEDSARQISQDGIDILVDLTGYTREARTAILAFRPAPVQVNYLGYAGTMGADFIDYLIADRFIIPPEQQQHYAEIVMRLPDSYMPRDRSCKRLPQPSRKECGLPEDRIVFCCFNSTYKFSPAIFDIWCRLLNSIPGSVLWLSASHPLAQANLAREAEGRGVTADRLIWAPRTHLIEDHLARIQCADLFLDTTPYNAHTTCSDALWMGVPVITCAGETFPSRVAGSLLTALRTPELITRNLEDYYALALELATDKNKYASIRNKIIANRESAPLFDSTKFTRDLEHVYQQMWDQYVNSSNNG